MRNDGEQTSELKTRQTLQLGVYMASCLRYGLLAGLYR